MIWLKPKFSASNSHFKLVWCNDSQLVLKENGERRGGGNSLAWFSWKMFNINFPAYSPSPSCIQTWMKCNLKFHLKDDKQSHSIIKLHHLSMVWTHNRNTNCTPKYPVLNLQDTQSPGLCNGTRRWYFTKICIMNVSLYHN